jgi:predicted Zn-dependent protease
MADVATAEAAYLDGDLLRAHVLASRAMTALDKGSPEWLHASDIAAATEDAAQKAQDGETDSGDDGQFDLLP